MLNEETKKQVQVWFTGVVQGLVDHPEDVKVSIEGTPHNAIIALRTNPADVGVIVGRSGHVAASLRSLIAVVAGRYRVALTLENVTDLDMRAQHYRNRDRQETPKNWSYRNSNVQPVAYRNATVGKVKYDDLG